MKFWPGVVPQCPSSMCLMSVSASGRFSSGLSIEINLADRQIVGGTPVGVHFVQQIGRQRFVRLIHLLRFPGDVLITPFFHVHIEYPLQIFYQFILDFP